MGQYTFPELEQGSGPWRKVAKVSLVAFVFLAAFVFAFFKVGPWVRGIGTAPEEEILSDSGTSAAPEERVQPSSRPGPSESRVWVAPHETESEAQVPPEEGSGQEGQPGEGLEGGEAPGDGGRRIEEPAGGGTQPPAEPEPPLPPKITTTFYRVQLGVFSDREKADALSEELVERGYSTYVTQTQSGNRVLYKVQVGAFEEEGNAKVLADELEGLGYEVTVTSSSG